MHLLALLGQIGCPICKQGDVLAGALAAWRRAAFRPSRPPSGPWWRMRIAATGRPSCTARWATFASEFCDGLPAALHQLAQ